ncbi:Substrate-binding region of ABC-type glycine betaine transport system [Thermosinus carboxydivorans Nor1]|uniref:Substrate-binding region of ABC-type glycine betaine transport system n=1 Tax=Thermosinus carboxydivorans Nor1 TaxID=401526 RepID=A1HLY3_9FIRM|nr:ABC transporter substrate-binding protein [Thermosinus carboxydivorans]EAX48836.1 Substrate-binding region of ABC-type glycine betaine transport system [Thermosinus carboxydivorans Nor1]
MSKKWFKLTAILTLMLFVVVFAAGCSSGQQPQQAAAPKTKQVKIAISTWSGFGPLFIARDKGFFKKYGIDMDIQMIQGLAERKQALAGRKVDGLAITFDIVSQTVAAGLPVKVIWALADSAGGDGILVKSGINSVQDLRGKEVAFDYGTVSHVFLTMVLDKAGMTEKDIKIVQMTGGDAGAAFVSGKIDAAVTWEPWLSKATKESKGKVLATSKDFPGLIVDTIAFHADFAKENPDVLQGVVNAMKDAMDWYAANPDEGNKIMAQGLKISEQEMKENLQGELSLSITRIM